MRQDDYWGKQTKHRLRAERMRGRKFVIMKLNQRQKEFVESLGYKVEPHLYEITTRTFYNVRGIKYKILEDIHYDKKKGKYHSVRTLKPEEISVLEKFSVKYRILKYKVYLCE